MRVTIVGSSHGVPEANRKCSCIMVEVGENIYFVDMGTSAIDALRNRGLSMDAVKGVFITHMHGDHINGLIPFVDLINWYFKTANPVICLPNPEAARVIHDWMQVTLNSNWINLTYQKVQSGEVFNDGVLKVTAFATQHCKDSFVYLLEAEGKAVLCTGDLKHPSVDMPNVIRQRSLDLLICESAHFPAMDYLPVLEGCRIQKVCVTHYSYKRLGSVMELHKTLTEQGQAIVLATDDLQLQV